MADDATSAAAPRATVTQRIGSLGGRTAVILAVLLALVAAADRSGLLADWSADRRFTLSPRLVSLLHAQHEPVGLVGIWGGEDQAALGAVEAMLQRMGEVSPQVTWRRLDPELQKPLVNAFANRFHEAQPRTLYITRGERAFAIAIGPEMRPVLQREIGGALVTLSEPTLPAAYLLRGHGELRAGGSPGDGGDLLARALALAGFQVQTLDGTAAQAPAPDGLLVVAGPTAPLGSHDLGLLDQHLTDGGGLLVLADDRCPDDLTRWLRRHGLFLGSPDPADPDSTARNPGLVAVSLKRHFVGQENAFPHHNLALDTSLMNPQHPVTAPLAGSGVAVISPWTSPVWLLTPDPQDANGQALAQRYIVLGTSPFNGQPLLGTAPADAWAKPRAAPLEAPTDLDKRGPLPLAWAVEYQPAAQSVRAGIGGRLALWGSRQGACDGVLAQANFANDRFLRSAAAWAARRTAITDIPEAEVAAFQVNASDQALFWIMAGLIALVPCCCIGAAMLTWWDRR